MHDRREEKRLKLEKKRIEDFKEMKRLGIAPLKLGEVATKSRAWYAERGEREEEGGGGTKSKTQSERTTKNIKRSSSANEG